MILIHSVYHLEAHDMQLTSHMMVISIYVNFVRHPSYMVSDMDYNDESGLLTLERFMMNGFLFIWQWLMVLYKVISYGRKRSGDLHHLLIYGLCPPSLTCNWRRDHNCPWNTKPVGSHDLPVIATFWLLCARSNIERSIKVIWKGADGASLA